MKRSLLALSLSLSLSLSFADAIAFAQPSLPAVEAARLFDAGAQAYAAGQFTVAIQAFEQAIQILPKPAIHFSLAQAQRRQYFIDKNPANLKSSMHNFRVYLEKEPQGSRRVDAAQALSELEMLESRSGDSATSKPAAKSPPRFWFMSNTPGATVSVDGSPPKLIPIGIEVGPGKHRVNVMAPGFFPDDREIASVDGVVLPVDVTLREKPAALVVDGPRGAEIAVDGRVMGEIGKIDSVEVPAGIRFVTVSKNGRQPFAQELELQRGEKKSLAAPLRVTQQRMLAYGFVGAAGVSTVLSGLFALSALGHEREAKQIDRERQEKTITPPELARYEDEVRQRDRDVTGAMIALGVAAGVGAFGAALWLFDQPSVPATPARRESNRPASPPAREPTEIGIGPGPGTVGAAVHARF